MALKYESYQTTNAYLTLVTIWLTVRHMVTSEAVDLDRVFAALADPTRRATLARLSEGPASVSELAAPFEMSKPAVSKHLKVLREAGLLVREIDGRHHRCSLRSEPLRQASEWISTYDRFWSSGLDGLEAFLNSQNDADPGSS